MSQAATPGHGSPLVQQVSCQFGGGDRAEGGIYEGQVHEKEVHESRKCGAEGDGLINFQEVYEPVVKHSHYFKVLIYS